MEKVMGERVINAHEDVDMEEEDDVSMFLMIIWLMRRRIHTLGLAWE